MLFKLLLLVLYVSNTLSMVLQHLERRQQSDQNGTCLNGFSLYQNSCYFIGSKGSEISWADARLHCQALGKNVDLVSIHSAFEQAYVAQQSNGVDTWIGLLNEDGDWAWVDNTPVDYTDWAPKEPSGDGSCVHLDQKRGMLWNDNNCDGNYGDHLYITQYICKASAT